MPQQTKFEPMNLGEKAYNLGLSKPDIPPHISNNLRHEFFSWQKMAFERLITAQQIRERENRNDPTHLMFNMATGAGKTLLMAAAILYYYEKGYRHFLFFVNRNNIVDKTENNFIDRAHPKYLFRDKVVIGEKTVAVKKVNDFSSHPQGIEIKFASIQKLYNDIHLQRENQTSLDDLQSRDIVMLADEAHHLNANTRGGEQRELTPSALTNRTGQAEVERKGWEHTVISLILNKDGRKSKAARENKNVLLEFTATVPDNENVAEKYRDKIVHTFGLKEFLQAGHTKEINLISSSLGKKERVLQALLFQWYRHAVAIKHGIANFKPVILFRSKTIEESRQDYDDFLRWIGDIRGEDFNFLRAIDGQIMQNESAHEQGASRTKQIMAHIKKEGIAFSEIAQWIKRGYQEKNTIITNSKSNKTGREKTDAETERLLNSLEDKNNHIRAIFTVDRLTEGWDVLNLFDIVRLYQGQNAGGSAKRTPEATVKEKQLIGRGVRYCPFAYGDKPDNKRKFDNDLNHELRILEELFYYTYDEQSRYISHLKAELRKDGYITDNKVVKTFAVKPAFRQGGFYRQAKIWYNRRVDNPQARQKTLDNLGKDFFPPYAIRGLEYSETGVNLQKADDTTRAATREQPRRTIAIRFGQIEPHIVREAILIRAGQNKAPFQFETLSKMLRIDSMDDLHAKLLADFEIRIVVEGAPDAGAPACDSVNNRDKLELTLKFLDAVFAELEKNFAPKIGSDFSGGGSFQQFFGEPKIKTINQSNLDDEVARQNDWYVLDGFVGTSEERALVEFIKDNIGNLRQKYDEFYLLRNEEVYKIYDFEQGRGFCPDFILFLKAKNDKRATLHYQIFIEPKGNEYLDSDGAFHKGKEGWKEAFLTQISEKYGDRKIITAENDDYKLFGLPFFNTDNNTKFREGFDPFIE